MTKKYKKYYLNESVSNARHAKYILNEADDNRNNVFLDPSIFEQPLTPEEVTDRLLRISAVKKTINS